jgi:hypothetical protein
MKFYYLLSSGEYSDYTLYGFFESDTELDFDLLVQSFYTKLEEKLGKNPGSGGKLFASQAERNWHQSVNDYLMKEYNALELKQALVTYLSNSGLRELKYKEHCLGYRGI